MNEEKIKEIRDKIFKARESLVTQGENLQEKIDVTTSESELEILWEQGRKVDGSVTSLQVAINDLESLLILLS